MKRLLGLIALLFMAGVSHAQGVVEQPANTVMGCGNAACAPHGYTTLPIQIPANTVLGSVAGGAPGALQVGSELLINVKNYGAKEDGVTDDSAALATAVAQVNTFAALTVPVYACVYIPAGVMYVNSGGPFAFNQGVPGCIEGDGGEQHSVIKLGSGFSGDLFTWSDAWNEYNGETLAGLNSEGPKVEGIEVLGYKAPGFPANSSPQNILNFYDVDEFIYINDVSIIYASGYGFRCGVLKNDTMAFCRESMINNFRLNKVGNTTTSVPSVLIYTDCTNGTTCTQAGINSSNQIDFVNFRDYAPQGSCISILNNRSQSPIDKIRFANWSCEGDEQDQTGGARAGNLVQIGSTTLAGKENELSFVNGSVLGPYTGYYGIGITGTSSLVPWNIEFLNQIFEHGSGGGGGLSITAGYGIRVQSDGWSDTGTDLYVGPASGGLNGVSPITIDFEGQENTLATNIDPTSMQYLQFGSFRPGIASSATIPASGPVFNGTVSAPAWTTNGVGLVGGTATFTDTTSTGTIANDYVYVFPTPTLASSNAITLNNAYTLVVPAPVAGTNTTNPGTGQYFSIDALGGVLSNGLLKSALGLSSSGAAANINLNSNFNTNLNTGSSTGTTSIGNAASTLNINAGTINITHGETTICSVASATPLPAGGHTGDSNETNLAVCTVPAGVMGTQGKLEITALWYRNAVTTNSITYTIRLNASSGAVTGAPAFTQVSNTSSVVAAQTFTMIQNTAAAAQIAWPSLAAPYSVSATAALTTGSINTANASYVNFNCTDTSSTSDTCGIYGYTVKLVTP